LEEAWKTQHSLLRHATAPELLNQKKDSFRPGLCHSAGMCVCKGSGEQAHFFEKKLMMLLKRHIMAPRRKNKNDPKPSKPRARVLVDKAFLVLKLSVAAHTDADHDVPVNGGGAAASSWEQLAADCLQAAGHGPVFVDTVDRVDHLWLHISYINFSSFKSSVLELHGQPSEDGCLVLKVAHEPVFATMLESLSKHMDFKSRWSASWYSIKSGDRVLREDEMIPGVIEVLPIASAELPSMTVWEGDSHEKHSRDQFDKRQREAAAKRAARSARGPRNGPRHAQAGLGRGRARKPALPVCDHVLDEGSQGEGSGGEGVVPSEDDVSAGGDKSADESHEPEWAIWADVAAVLPQPPEDPLPVPPPPFPPPPPPDLVPPENEGSAEAEVEDREVAKKARKTREVTEDIFEVPGGDLRYNVRTNTIVAHCKFEVHGDCRKNRTCSGGRVGGLGGQGRPIGFLMAWLQRQDQHECRQTHVHVPANLVTHADRVAGRHLFMTLPGAQEFSQHERAKRPDEPDEPIVI
jgi:hypothetical protein